MGDLDINALNKAIELIKKPLEIKSFEEWIAHVLSSGIKVLPQSEYMTTSTPILFVSQELYDLLPKPLANPENQE